MRVLVLGGTQFVGRTIVEHALAAGHSVTITNRGLTSPTAAELFGERVEHIVSDRGGDLGELEGRRWDVAIDVNGYLPRDVASSARRLADAVGMYCTSSRR